ncbi:MAG: transcription-repair coupling factor [Pseudomonadota bacterium]|nr:transcription-repair coupling factor [Pseudomonadota bacterium]
MAWLADVPKLVGKPLGGLVGGAGPYALARLRRGWIVVPTREDADHWFRALRYFGAPARLYPADDGRPWDGLSPHPDLPRQRLTARIATDALVVVPAKALLLRVPRDVEVRELRVGEEYDRAALLVWLGARGYLATQRVAEPGCWSVRGGLTDIWPTGEAAPVRIEWFDEEIVSIRSFDPATQRGTGKRDRVRVLSAREATLDAATAERAAAYIHALASERELPPTERRRVLQDLRNGVWFPGAEDYYPALIDLAPLAPGAPLYVVEPDLVHAELVRFEELVRARFDGLDPEDRPLVRPFDRYLPAAEARLDGAIALTSLVFEGSVPFETRTTAALKVGAGDLAPVAKQLRAWVKAGRAVTVVAESAGRAERLRALFEPHGLAFGTGRAGPSELRLDVGDLPDGFVSEEAVYVTADEMFVEQAERRSAASDRSGAADFRRAAVASFASVRPGDLVVHDRHGIGQYRGLARMPLGEVAGDFVIVAFRDGEKLYVPVHRLDLLTPYRSVGEGAVPRLDRLGGATWDARRAKVKDAVLKMAHELLRLYARRKIVRAEAFHGTDALYRQFEETFPFVETPDQDRAIADVLHDLGRDDPMDRLLVGDVGFGKTEVAMRACFRVVEGGAQAVVLCPTTILAFQHGESFRRRMENFPVRVEVLSRFQSAADVKRIHADLAAGSVDVLIATTRALGRSVRFKNLGLVVVDEEHRFGVAQKEALKKLALGAHMLAMSATPIPRTLQMALSGVRALSVMATPPGGRHPVRTEIARFNADRVREDVLHELRRGGQVYFVHNRVEDIEAIAQWVREVVPEAKVAVGHGQMSDDALERVLVGFVRHETNVFVCTTIIESGVDLPNVNTMIIDNADQLGLAQLYQLRGRIGRGTKRAACTLLVRGAGELRREAIARLRVLQDNTELGSGFALASSDLELRGGGELLGDKQHGHIAAIGFDAYLELLEDAVQEAKGEASRRQLEPEIEVAAPAWLPEDYVPEMPERLEAYQRLARARTREEVRGVIERLEHSFGPPPPEALNLGWLSETRVRCRELGIEHIAFLKVRLLVRLHAPTNVQPRTVERLLVAEPARFRRLGERELEVRFTPEEGAHPFRVLEWVLQRLSERPEGEPDGRAAAAVAAAAAAVAQRRRFVRP